MRIVPFLILFLIAFAVVAVMPADAADTIHWTLSAPAVDALHDVPASLHEVRTVGVVSVASCESGRCRVAVIPKAANSVGRVATAPIRAVRAVQPLKKIAAIRPVQRLAAARPIRRAAGMIRAVQPARRVGRGVGWLFRR